jgi:transposase-like protein
MKRSETYIPALREEAVKLVLTQGLTLEDAALRLSIPRALWSIWARSLRENPAMGSTTRQNQNYCCKVGDNRIKRPAAASVITQSAPSGPCFTPRIR